METDCKLQLVLHLAGIANFAYCVHQELNVHLNDETSLLKILEEMGASKYWYWCQYLTHWNVWVQLLYYILAFTNDLFGTYETDVRYHSLNY